MSTAQPATPSAPPQTESSGFLAQFAVLRGAVRELWIAFGAKLLAITAYGLMNSTIVLWLSSDFGYNDQNAANMVAIWSTTMTLCTVVVGSLVDAIGLRKALLGGFALCLVSRAVMTFAGVEWLALPFGLFLVAVGEAMLTPVLVAAIKRYSNTRQRSIAFSLMYAIMNLGFGIGSWIFDYVRFGLGEHGQFTLPVFGVELSTYRTIFLLSFVLTLCNLGLIYFFLRDGVEVTDTGVVITNSPLRSPTHSLLRMAISVVRESGKIFAGLWRLPAFYKFLIFLSLVVPVRLIFIHMYYTYPKFGIRELGATATTFSMGEIRNPHSFALKLKDQSDPLAAYLLSHFSPPTQQMLAGYPGSGLDKKTLQAALRQELNGILQGGSIYTPERFTNVTLRPPTQELLSKNPEARNGQRLNRLLLENAYPKFVGAGVPIGRLWSVNSIMIVILVPIVGALTQKIRAYPMVVVGSLIAASSVFLMALPPSWFQGMANGALGYLVAHVWLGVEGAVNPYYVMIFIYVVFLSVGEALYSPRLYEYTACIAPKGQEASYLSMSYLPFFLAKFVVAISSGRLLAAYCPETGPRNSQMLWLIIAVTTMITPVALLTLRRFIQVKEEGRE